MFLCVCVCVCWLPLDQKEFFLYCNHLFLHIYLLPNLFFINAVVAYHLILYSAVGGCTQLIPTASHDIGKFDSFLCRGTAVVATPAHTHTLKKVSVKTEWLLLTQ